jgi:hypothetical protein
MPRKKKTDVLTDDGTGLLREIYVDSFTVKTMTMKILSNISKNVDYNNKEEVMETLPLVQKQIELFLRNNEILMSLEQRLAVIKNNTEDTEEEETQD